MTTQRATALRVGTAVVILTSTMSIMGCHDETPTQPQSNLSYYVAPNATVLPMYVSTTGIPFIRTGGLAGTLRDMNETGWAVGSGTRAGRLLAMAVNIRTGDTVPIGRAFANAPSQAKAINARGEVVGGEPLLGQAATAFYWRDGVLTELGSGAGMDINDNGVAVGYSWENFVTHPWVRREGQLQFLGQYGSANAINNRGDIVGVAPLYGTGIWVPTIWKDGIAAPVFGGSGPGEATAINDQGQIVGWATHGGVQEAFVWRNGIVTWLGTLEWGQPSRATGINNRGEIVGNATVAGTSGPVLRAVLWRNGQPIHLGLSGVTGEDVSEAFGITNSGQVVGRVGYNPGFRNGVVWMPPPW